jgi:hypothetical protein
MLDKAEGRGMKRCFRKHKALARRMERMHVEHSKKQEIYRTIDRQIEIAGKVKRLEYILKKRQILFYLSDYSLSLVVADLP